MGGGVGGRGHEDSGGSRAEVGHAPEAGEDRPSFMTYGTEGHLALDTGQTLPDFPHSLPFTDKWIPRRDSRVTAPSCHPLCVWSLARVLGLAL